MPRDLTIQDGIYDAFGILMASSGITPIPFGFIGGWGYQEDVDSGLKLLGHRYYDGATSRFLCRDNGKDGRNWYAYADNNPLRYADPEGTARIELRYRNVVGTAWHAYIAIIDENTGRVWTISGGPTTHDPHWKRKDKFIGVFAGPYVKGNYDVDSDPNHTRIQLVDDNLPASDWIKRASQVGRELRGSEVDYHSTGPNSNSLAREILERLGITVPPKRHKTWVPGWYDDPWGNRRFTPKPAPVLNGGR